MDVVVLHSYSRNCPNLGLPLCNQDKTKLDWSSHNIIMTCKQHSSMVVQLPYVLIHLPLKMAAITMEIIMEKANHTLSITNPFI